MATAFGSWRVINKQRALFAWAAETFGKLWVRQETIFRLAACFWGFQEDTSSVFAMEDPGFAEFAQPADILFPFSPAHPMQPGPSPQMPGPLPQNGTYSLRSREGVASSLCFGISRVHSTADFRIFKVPSSVAQRTVILRVIQRPSLRGLPYKFHKDHLPFNNSNTPLPACSITR